MNNDAYQKLLLAIEKNELYDYLVAKNGYRIFDPNEKNFAINNNYMEVARSLKKYGENDLNFQKQINLVMLKILKNNIIGEIYSVCQLVRIQLISNSLSNSNFDYVNENLLNSLKESIQQNKEKFEKLRIYESQLKQRGMMQVFENWDKEINAISGKHIL